MLRREAASANYRRAASASGTARERRVEEPDDAPLPIGAPETGNTIISMPMLLSTNPIGSIVDHVAMHVSAVAHNYETEERLPPPTNAD